MVVIWVGCSSVRCFDIDAVESGWFCYLHFEGLIVIIDVVCVGRLGIRS